MIPPSILHSRAPWAIMPDRLEETLAALTNARPPRKPVYKEDESGYDLADDWSLAQKHNQARLMIQRVGNGTALIQIRGVILKDCDFWLWAEGYATPLKLIDAALDMVAEQGYSALILEFDSPGGSTVGLYETASRIKSLAGRGINTTAYTSSCCASAAYFLASACREIFASPTAIVGSIGVYSVFVDFSKAAEMQGLKFMVFVAREAPIKGAGNDGSLTPEQQAEMQRHVDEADATFQAQVKGARRKLDLEAASTGAWWDAKSAPKGLVDDAGLFHSIEDLLAIAAA